MGVTVTNAKIKKGAGPHVSSLLFAGVTDVTSNNGEHYDHNVSI